jgi:hypothetical protein
MPDIMAPKEATIVQFAPGEEAAGEGPSEPYQGPSPGWYYGQSLNGSFAQGFQDADY